jgi:hypothetical protein
LKEEENNFLPEKKRNITKIIHTKHDILKPEMHLLGTTEGPHSKRVEYYL